MNIYIYNNIYILLCVCVWGDSWGGVAIVLTLWYNVIEVKNMGLKNETLFDKGDVASIYNYYILTKYIVYTYIHT